MIKNNQRKSKTAADGVERLPRRSQVKAEDRWNLASLFADDQAWERGFAELESRIPGYDEFRGTLGESPASLARCLVYDYDTDRLAERVGCYAFLRAAEDQAENAAQAMLGRFRNVATRASQAASFIRPELLAIAAGKWKSFLADKKLQPYRLALERVARYRKHTLGKKEEELLAMQGEMAQAASRTFRQLHDADLKFGEVRTEAGQKVELSNATFIGLLHSPDRGVRRTAFRQYYRQFAGHANTLAALLGSSIQKDVYYAKARGYSSSLSAALFPDNVPQSVYDNLIAAVRKNLPLVHRYYELRRRKMRLSDIHHYDTYVPILSDRKKTIRWNEAVRLVTEALAPLGKAYCDVLETGLRQRWCDRYPNKGKQSGAFSSGCYGSDPYILMNYKTDVFSDVFTLAHEAGHSMHSYFSARRQPFHYYEYSIFVAEVASTFNESLLSHHLLQRARDDQERAYLINRELDDMRATIVRQTMFAEFELRTHALAEAGDPLTVESFQGVYRELLSAYFGPRFSIDPELELECFRIPHFYRAFYVYKYATGLSAAIALSRRVLEGGAAELRDYLGFLEGGCSKDPLDLLRDAGVDMEQPEPVDRALARFGQLVDELDRLI